jgi:prepilin-type N-terminal cleavage/methylation domain-containing protein
MLERLKSTNFNRKGFTLVELLIALAIFAVIAVGLTTSVKQVMTINASTVSRETAIKQVENAVQFISRDAQQAQTVTTPSGSFQLNLAWTSWSSISYAVNYYLDGSTLMRRSAVGASIDVTKVAENINTDAGMTTCSWSETSGILNVQITVTTGGFKSASETRSFQIKTRSLH